MRKRPLLWFACSFILGLAFQRYGELILLCMWLICLFTEVSIGLQHKSYGKMAGRSLCLLSAFILGMAHMEREELFRENYLSQIQEESLLTIWGEIVSVNDTDYGVKMILSDCYISLEGVATPCNKVMVYASSNHFQVGEIHKITGEFHRFKEARNEGNFHSRKFYESQKIDFYLNEKESLLLDKNENVLRDFLQSFKEQLLMVYETCMDDRSAGFYKGMLLGDKEDLEEELKALFEVGGISHILAISGLHVSMIGRSLYKLLRKVRFQFVTASICAGAALLLYGYMVAGGVSSKRAIGIMFFFFISQCIGRSYDMLNALGGICVLLLVDNPFLLEYSGFWFSVMALIGVGFVGAELEKSAQRGKALWMSIGITLTTLPIVAMNYFEIPLYSSLVNFALLPLLTPMFLFALAGGFIGLYLPIIAKWVLLPSAWGLYVYETVCEFVERFPAAMVITGTPLIKQVMVYYVFLFVGIMIYRQIKSKNWLFAGAMSVFCVAMIFFPKSHDFEISFLDVGQGDAIYISSGDGTNYFIDGGSSDVKDVGKYRILPFLKYNGVKKIDYWFVSHADADHVSGLVEIMESGYIVNNLVLAEASLGDEKVESLCELAVQKGINVVYMKAGDVVKSKNISFTCIYPEKRVIKDRNESSLVLLLEVDEGSDIENFRALFAGDISEKIEQKLLSNTKLEKITLLKGIHHGSNYSNSKAFLQSIRPEYVVISCGADNLYGHPGEKAISNIQSVKGQILYTMESGQVSIGIDRNDIWLEELIEGELKKD